MSNSTYWLGTYCARKYANNSVPNTWIAIADSNVLNIFIRVIAFRKRLKPLGWLAWNST